jgi:hypothetical protein
VGSTLSDGHEDFDLATDQLSSRIPGQAFRLPVHKNDHAGWIRDHHRIRDPFEQFVAARGRDISLLSG